MEDETDHLTAHHRLVREIAEQVEQRLVSSDVLITRLEEKAARRGFKWAIANGAAMVVTVATVLSAFNALDKQITTNQRINDLQDRVISSLESRDNEFRKEVLQELHAVRESLARHNELTTKNVR